MTTHPESDPFPRWFAALEARHLASRTVPEVRRALQALSSLYVERRDRLPRGAALDGAGKRAAFALFYGPLHFLFVRRVVAALGAADPPPARLLDLGCGTGAAGAAWALAAGAGSGVRGVDRHAWAVAEARWTWRTLGLAGRVRRGDLRRTRLSGPGEGILLAYAVNELVPEDRDRLVSRLLGAADRGARVLVVEPIARRVNPWWPAWSRAIRAAGGRDDDWRFSADLPGRLRLLDRAAGLDHRELTGRTLWLPGP